jgi:hypothetical protein
LTTDKSLNEIGFNFQVFIASTRNVSTLILFPGLIQMAEFAKIVERE